MSTSTAVADTNPTLTSNLGNTDAYEEFDFSLDFEFECDIYAGRSDSTKHEEGQDFTDQENDKDECNPYMAKDTWHSKDSWLQEYGQDYLEDLIHPYDNKDERQYCPYETTYNSQEYDDDDDNDYDVSPTARTSAKPTLQIKSNILRASAPPRESPSALGENLKVDVAQVALAGKTQHKVYELTRSRLCLAITQPSPSSLSRSAPVTIPSLSSSSPRDPTCASWSRSILAHRLIPSASPKLNAEVFADLDTRAHRPWVCESTLDILHVKTVDIPNEYGEDEGKLFALQKLVYGRLAHLTRLQVLWLGRMRTKHIVRCMLGDQQKECLELTLESGLAALSTLKRLAAEQDVQWMVDNWPELETIYGV
ncbi:hypothetical protein BG000_011891 [Podila horticola]|nr:hypothetical protein BG000_011891 [Podila horticola]